MFSANVQTETGESLPIVRLDGHFTGKSILSFLMGFLTYCDARSKDRAQTPSEFDRFSPRARQALCAACADLMRAVVNADWDYCDGEDYKSYVTRTGDHDLSEDAFVKGAAHYQAAWTDIHALIARVQVVIIQLEMAPSTDNPDLLGGSSLVDFRALYDTLDVALSRGASHARLDIH